MLTLLYSVKSVPFESNRRSRLFLLVTICHVVSTLRVVQGLSYNLTSSLIHDCSSKQLRWALCAFVTWNASLFRILLRYHTFLADCVPTATLGEGLPRI